MELELFIEKMELEQDHWLYLLSNSLALVGSMDGRLQPSYLEAPVLLAGRLVAIHVWESSQGWAYGCYLRSLTHLDMAFLHPSAYATDFLMHFKPILKYKNLANNVSSTWCSMSL
jgi:hypothetical protein